MLWKWLCCIPQGKKGNPTRRKNFKLQSVAPARLPVAADEQAGFLLSFIFRAKSVHFSDNAY
jgi:hypothetical protein